MNATHNGLEEKAVVVASLVYWTEKFTEKKISLEKHLAKAYRVMLARPCMLGI